ncbi:hypothetical protein SARC_15172 [Sphaeroforma arctica JP610]|uniref:Uncharacterized protein n=1 Tax=Sphaeroforma arctica JP610 TaxID=667725 RepID=A0A0L0F826_9EUKA|nr:hypothetical protein SARC_15172 [Sphaeroforma arctica JP610]KNC72273.1 hypothetical protein SARC_15172 [Sphaeroforma arctica JP610]|eukprot:XP_014146175.1 hypothetical protein SARC_15172 [Sphaeroforma arctica JP610]
MYSRLGLCLPIVWLISLVSYQHSSVNAAKILTAPDIDATVANGDNEESDNTDLIFDTDESSDPRTYNNMPVPLVPIGDEQNNFLQSYGVWCGGNHGM